MFCKTLLAERLDLEQKMQAMCPRFILFLSISALLGTSLLGSVSELGTINHALVHAFQLEDYEGELRSTEDVREFMEGFAETAASFYPVNFRYVPDPELMRITQGIKQYQAGRTLPAELRPRLRTSFTLVSWVASDVETWIVRTEPRGVIVNSGLQSCWAWRYPGQFVYGFHDIAIDMPSRTSREPLSIVARTRVAPEVSRKIAQEAVVINLTHATFYRDAIELDAVPLPRPVTDCMSASLIVGDATGVQIGQLTYYPRALSAVELFEVRFDGMPLLDLVSGGTATADEATSDADFTTERVAMEHAQAQQDRVVEAEVAATRSTRTTLAVRTEVRLNRAVEVSVTNNGSAASAVHVAATSADYVCYADEPCEPSFAPPAWGNSSSFRYMRLVEGLSCTAEAPTAAILGCDTCGVAQTSNATAVSYSLCTPRRGFEPALYTACAASTCDGSWQALGAVGLEYRDRAYVIDTTGETYAGVEGQAYNVDDPKPTSNSSAWSVSFNFRLMADRIQLPIFKTRRAYAPSEIVPEAEICWGVFVDGLFNRISVLPYASYESLMNPRTAETPASGHVLSCDAADLDVNEYKHVAFVADGSTLALYLEGKLLCRQTDLPPITDCAGGTVRVGGTRGPLESLWMVGSIYGAQKFSRALSAAEVLEDSICKDVPVTDSITYSDVVGNRCEWYARFRSKRGESLCDAETRAACPIACGVTRSCPKRFFLDRLFKRTELLSPPAICNTYSGEADLYEQLALYANLTASARSSSGRRLGHLPQVTTMNVLDHMTTGACSNDEPPLDNYDVSDFSIVLWTRGKNHMIQLQREYSAARGFATGGTRFSKYAFEFTTPSVTWVLDLSGEDEYDIDLRLSGGDAVKEDQWIMRAISYNGTHLCSFLNGESACRYLPGFTTQRVHSVYVAPLSSSTAKLDTMLISPIRTYSPAMSEAALTRMYYQELSTYSEQMVGPRSTNFLVETKRQLDLGQYPRSTYIFVPPLTFQERFKTGSCATFAQSTETVFESLRTAKCDGYDCGDVDPIIQCIADGGAVSHTDDAAMANQTYFGRSASVYKGGHVFSEFLHTFRSGVLVYRNVDGQPKTLNLEAYLDGLTRKQTILALTYTPKLNTASKLEVAFDFTKPVIQPEYKIEHFRGLTGSVKANVLGSDIAIMVCAALMLLFVLLDAWQRRQRWKFLKKLALDSLSEAGIDPDTAASQLKVRHERKQHVMGAAIWLLELALSISIFIYALVHYRNAELSNRKLQSVYGAALNVPWTSQEVKYNQKVGDFFTAVDSIEELLSTERTFRDLSFVLVLCCVVRIVGYLTVHPRINFLAATLAESGDDIAHFVVSFSLVFMMLAVLAHAQFGESNLEYATLLSSCLTQFKLVTAGIEDYGDESPLYVLYIVLVYAAQGLFMLNFFLAIVVDAYSVVKQKVVDQVTEQSFWQDSIDIAILAVRRLLSGWPSMTVIISRLERHPEEVISRAALIGILGDERRAESFISYYSQYEFVLSSSKDAEAYIQAHVEKLAEDSKTVDAVAFAQPRAVSKTPEPTSVDITTTPSTAEVLKVTARRSTMLALAEENERLKMKIKTLEEKSAPPRSEQVDKELHDAQLGM